MYKRYDAKYGKTHPQGFVPAQDPDAITGHWPGWLKVGEGSEDKWFREGFLSNATNIFKSGTFELVGPKINGNKEGFERHLLIPHGEDFLEAIPRTYEALKQFFDSVRIEGIVWYHPDGRRAKIKRKDFGYKW